VCPLPALKAYTKYNVQLTEKALHERIASLPDGVCNTYEFVEYDGFGTDELYPVFCEMTVQGDRLKFRFSGCPQIPAFVNVGRAGLEGSLIGAIMCQFVPDIPFNEGFWNCLDIEVGEPGTIVNPVVPAPVCSGHASAGMRVGRMVQETLSHACAASNDPDIRARASGVNSGAIAMAFWVGEDGKGQPTMFLPFGMIVSLGGAAQTVGDGQDGSGMASTLAIKWSDIEVHELDSPVMALWRRRRPNAGGAGATRGGVSIDEAFILYGTDEFVGINFINSLEVPARGFAGGFPGGGAFVLMIRGTEVREMLRRGKLPSSPEKIGGTLDTSIKGNQTGIRFGPNDVSRGYAGGSGGVGDPFLRSPADVECDLNEGTITSGAAEALFGAVVIGDNPYRVDEAATWQKRNQLRAEIVQGATVDLASIPRRTICQGVIMEGDDWVCSHCDSPLASSTDSWIGAAVTVNRDLADLFEEADTMIRRNQNHPAILVEHYCPNCASCLQADVQLTGSEYDTPAFRLGLGHSSDAVEDLHYAAARSSTNS
jgi:N-methylhydantoinase B